MEFSEMDEMVQWFILSALGEQLLPDAKEYQWKLLVNDQEISLKDIGKPMEKLISQLAASKLRDLLQEAGSLMADLTVIHQHSGKLLEVLHESDNERLAQMIRDD